MPNKFKSSICFGLSAVFIAMSLTGCGTSKNGNQDAKAGTGKETTQSKALEKLTLPLSKEKVEYEMLVKENPASPYLDSFIVAPELEKRTNVKLKIQPVPSDSWKQKISIVLASGNIPDIIFMADDKKQMNDLGPKGMFLNIAKYMDYMPNLRKVIKDYPEINNYKYSKDELYGLPNNFNTPSNAPPTLFMVREDILKKHNLKTPQTTDELYSMLLQLKKLYPDVYPWVNRNGIKNVIDIMSPSWGVPVTASDSNTNYYYLDSKTGKQECAIYSDNFKKMIEFISKCYSEGLIDKEFILTPTKQWEEKISTNKGFFAVDWLSKVLWANDLTKKNNPNTEFKLASILPPKPPVAGANQLVWGAENFNFFTAISNKAKNPEVLAQFMDYWYYSEEGSILSWLGIEGKSFVNANKLSEDKLKVLNYTDDIKVQSNPNGKVEPNKHLGLFYDAMKGVTVNYHGWVRKDKVEIVTDRDIASDLYKDHKIVRPTELMLTEEEKENEKDIRTVLNDFIDTELSKFLVGHRPISEWDKFVGETKKKDADKLLKTYNDAQTRANKAK